MKNNAALRIYNGDETLFYSPILFNFFEEAGLHLHNYLTSRPNMIFKMLLFPLGVDGIASSAFLSLTRQCRFFHSPRDYRGSTSVRCECE